MRIRAALLTAITAVAAVAVLSLPAPVQAKATTKGKITAPVNYFYLGTGEEEVHGPLGVTIQAFQQACRADRALVSAGQAPRFVTAMVASPLNGYDAFIVDLKTEKMGAFAAKGPGAKPAGPEVSGIQHTEYDMDLAFYADPTTDVAASKTACPDANKVPGGNRSHRCFSSKETPDEKTGCIVGYKDAKGKIHGARYLIVNAVLNLRGSGFDITITHP